MNKEFYPGDTLTSPSGNFVMNTDKNGLLQILGFDPTGQSLVYRHHIFWGPWESLNMQPDDNLAIYYKGQLQVASGTENQSQPVQLQLRSDGQLCVTYVSNGVSLWCEAGGWTMVNNFPPPPNPSPDITAPSVIYANTTGKNYISSIPMGTSFYPTDTLTSSSGIYVLRYSQMHGLEIVSMAPSGLILSRDVIFNGQFTSFDMQTDGNAVIYVNGGVGASAGINNDGGTSLVLQNDGNLCVSNGNSNVWCISQGWS